MRALCSVHNYDKDVMLTAKHLGKMHHVQHEDATFARPGRSQHRMKVLLTREQSVSQPFKHADDTFMELLKTFSVGDVSTMVHAESQLNSVV